MDDNDYDDLSDDETCLRCGGEGFIEYNDAPETWGRRLPVGSESLGGVPGMRWRRDVSMTQRTAKSELRRWCPEAKTHQDADDPVCAWMDHSHRLRLRRMWICSVCEMGFFERDDFSSHECWSAH